MEDFDPESILESHTVRIDAIFPSKFVVTGDSAGSLFEDRYQDFFDSEDFAEDVKHFTDFRNFEDVYPELWEFIFPFQFAGELGFFVMVSRPVMNNRNGILSYSWGHYHTGYFYVKNLNDLPNRVDRWVKEKLINDDES